MFNMAHVNKKNLTQHNKKRKLMIILESLRHQRHNKVSIETWNLLEASYPINIRQLRRIWKQYNQDKNQRIYTEDSNFLKPKNKNMNECKLCSFMICFQTFRNSHVIRRICIV